MVWWPWSLIKDRPKWEMKTIFGPAEEMERINLDQKLALDTSQIKRFYYGRWTIYKDRYVKNFFNLLDVNGYFFAGHPREGVPGIVYRNCFPWWLLPIWLWGCFKVKWKWWWLGPLLIVPLFKNGDGWNLVMWWPMTVIFLAGVKDLNEKIL